MGSEWVTIADNADPMQLVVYKRARSVRGARQVCEQPVFEKGTSATDQSLIGTRRTMIVENNYGHAGPATVSGGKRTRAGFERVDINRDGRGCRTVWKNTTEIAPSVVPKLSLANGLIYTYTLGPESTDPWYLTALDYETGRLAWKARAGHGFGYNNNFAPVTLGGDGTAYVGVLGGLIAMRDATPPPGATAPRPSLAIRSTRTRARRLVVRLSGVDLQEVESVRFTARRRVASARRPPFKRVYGLRALGRARRVTVSARVLMLDGRVVTLRRVARR